MRYKEMTIMGEYLTADNIMRFRSMNIDGWLQTSLQKIKGTHLGVAVRQSTLIEHFYKMLFWHRETSASQNLQRCLGYIGIH
jgi:hypothetical protein